MIQPCREDAGDDALELRAVISDEVRAQRRDGFDELVNLVWRVKRQMASPGSGRCGFTPTVEAGVGQLGSTVLVKARHCQSRGLHHAGQTRPAVSRRCQRLGERATSGWPAIGIDASQLAAGVSVTADRRWLLLQEVSQGFWTRIDFGHPQRLCAPRGGVRGGCARHAGGAASPDASTVIYSSRRNPGGTHRSDCVPLQGNVSAPRVTAGQRPRFKCPRADSNCRHPL